MLSNFDIESIFHSYKTPLTFIGMKDQLPEEVKDGNYIINLQSSTEGNGTHWLALRIVKENAFFCDSFGASPPTEVVNFVKRREGSHLGFNNFIVQALKSENCGYYASSLLIFLNRHSNIPIYNAGNMFIKKFKDNATKNDDILKQIYAEFSINKPRLIVRLNNEKPYSGK